MNAKKFLTYAGMLMVTAAAFSSCAGDEPMAEAVQGREVSMSVRISRSDLNRDTRSVLEETNGNLKCTWEAGDCVLVTDVQGNKLGVLKVRPDGVGQETAEFDGTLTVTGQGKMNYNFFYLGRENSSEAKLIAMKNPATFDFSAQKGTLASLSDYDCFSSTQEVNVAGSVAYTEEMGLSRKSAFAHFELIFPAGTSYNGEEVTISGTGVYNTATLGFDNGYRLNPGAISLTGTRDFYITLLPRAGEAIEPVFSVTIDGREFEGTLSPRIVNASEFLRLSHGKGIPVEMEPTDVDHSKNPLYKWAESDLVYTKGQGNSFAANADTYGSLYQWGRNAGWANYLDAMGAQDYDRGVWGYGCYRMNGDTGLYLAATGLWSGYDDWLASSYNSVSQIRGNKEMFIFRPIDPADPDYMTGADYWIEEAFGDGGSTWQERAAKCGYENTPIAPEGWRLPTEAEFDEIMPAKASGNAPLAQLIGGKAEVRVNGDCTYAIRWTLIENTRRKLRVQAIVVPENFSADKLNTIDWTDDDVVTRDFGASGSIIGFGHENIAGNGVNIYRMPVARPMPGYETHFDQLGQVNSAYQTIYWMTYTNIRDWSRNNEAGYWISDVKKVYTFFDNTALQAGDPMSFGATSSYAGKLPILPQTAYSLRCVKD